MARVDHSGTNTTEFNGVGETLANVIFIDKILIVGATAADTVTITNTAGNLIWSWTFGGAGAPLSKYVDLNKQVLGIAFTAFPTTGKVYIMGKVTGTPAS